MQIIVNTIGLLFLLLILYVLQLQIIFYFSLNKVGVYLYFIFFLPGVIFHELAHLFMASILGVPTGDLIIFPRKDNSGSSDGRQSWILGKVASAETDIFRANLIGIAPMIVGITVLIAISNGVLGIKSFSDFTLLLSEIWIVRPIWQNIVLFYLILVFANTMFLSKEDRTSVWAIPLLLFLLFFFAKFLGVFDFLVSKGIVEEATNIFFQVISGLLVCFSLTLLVDILFILPLFLITRLIR